MGQEDARPILDQAATADDSSKSAVCTREICVLSTSIDDTRLAIGVAQDLARALAAPLTLIALRTTAEPDAQQTADASDSLSSLVRALRFRGLDIRVRSYVCRTERQAIPFAFRPHSLIFVGVTRSWLPTRTERFLRALEAAGHFVLCVDGSTTHHDQRFS